MIESFHLKYMRSRLAQLEEAIPEIGDANDRHEMERHAETLRNDIRREALWESQQKAIRATDTHIEA
jgi:hypothetical protein